MVFALNLFRARFFPKQLHQISNSFTGKFSTFTMDRIVWFDAEMTGLDPDTDHLMEVACVITDKNLDIVEEGPSIIIHQPKEIINNMNDWCLTTHFKTGLAQASLKSEISVKQAEEQLLNFVKRLTPQNKCPLAGNSVYMDLIFLRKYMPNFVSHLHYRLIDVSSIKLLSNSWYGVQCPQKRLVHRAIDDIKESINELKFYRETIFRLPEDVSLEERNKKI